MSSRQIDEVRRHSKAFAEIADKALARRMNTAAAGAPEARRALVENEALEGMGAPPEAWEAQSVAEAIVLAELRPVYFVMEDGIDLDTDVAGEPELVQMVRDNKPGLETLCASVGRVDLINHWTLPYGGTGFLIDEDLAVTNRHVARLFAEAIWNGFRFKRGRFGQNMEARLDYMQLHRSSATRRAEVEEVLYIAQDHEPDFALLRVRRRDEVAPLTLGATAVQEGHPVAVVGYPAEDGDRNEKDLMDRYFGGVYQVKRFAPGFVTGRDDNRVVLTSDYTSLGGNSGSPVISLDTGEVVALHFAGRFKENNFAVTSDVLAAARREVGGQIAVPEMPPATVETPAADLSGRPGYDADFLGTGALSVPLPRLGAWAGDAAPVAGTDDKILRYRNFSVVQSSSRRLPLLTAVNIDGAQSRRLKRRGGWRLDGRLAPEHQVGNQLYSANPLDRGHMVRRRDPGWGDHAEEAERDTFHYTNCAPQHRDLNQRDWLGLEDYILEAAETRDFRVTVFTGPVFRGTDTRLRDQPGAAEVAIPEEFWKVAVILDAATGALSATGYVLSHGPMIRDLVESPFVFGSYRTYQVQVARIEAETGLGFGALPDHDPLGAELSAEAPFAQVAREIDGPGSLLLARGPA
ncbi:DNA/RNA non-specific endonuclease [Salipiger mucosus]|uniref:DNA/RNA non-specific endonuclease n=1 Tax=Salipiger mucosus DSM 16094 TaxID=1123237 RepID=S9S4M9_9RHOB|nr:DNA/RNA non-specific endonuclease [Salipiger mucosus]EPX85130.1 DNA/RNA non-specific endonuclease [Salipiger mucosus DSM 16094]